MRFSRGRSPHSSWREQSSWARVAEYMGIVNAWPLKVGVAVSKGKTVAILLQSNLCRFFIVKSRKGFSKLIWMLRRAMRCKWGLRRGAARFIYVGFFLACSTYGFLLLYALRLSASGVVSVSACMSHSFDRRHGSVPPLDVDVVRPAGTRGAHFCWKLI